jgi:hypothetical protein
MSVTTAAKPARAPEAPRVIEPKEGSALTQNQKQEQRPEAKGSQRGGLLIALAFLVLLALFLATNMK